MDLISKLIELYGRATAAIKENALLKAAQADTAAKIAQLESDNEGQLAVVTELKASGDAKDTKIAGLESANATLTDSLSADEKAIADNVTKLKQLSDAQALFEAASNPAPVAPVVPEPAPAPVAPVEVPVAPVVVPVEAPVVPVEAPVVPVEAPVAPVEAPVAPVVVPVAPVVVPEPAPAVSVEAPVAPVVVSEPAPVVPVEAPAVPVVVSEPAPVVPVAPIQPTISY